MSAKQQERMASVISILGLLPQTKGETAWTTQLRLWTDGGEECQRQCWKLLESLSVSTVHHRPVLPGSAYRGG